MMSTYFHGGSEIQASPTTGDHHHHHHHHHNNNNNTNLQTLYLMNPPSNYMTAAAAAAYNNASSDPPNMLLLNPSPGPAAGLQQQLIGIPLSGPHHPEARPPSSGSVHPHDQMPPSLHGVAVSRVHYNLWGPPPDPSPAQGGLSLSLSPQLQQQQHQALPASMSVTVAAGGGTPSLADDNNNNNNNSSNNNGVILGSRYLRTAQELLDEVVKVVDSKVEDVGDKDKAKAAAVDMGSGQGPSSGSSLGEASSGSKRPAEQLTTAQRQELQMKKAKLLNMLDEVEQRYRQYHSQMQAVVSSFEQAAGLGSANSYTCLALKTISRQFRCLKDAITAQVKATGRSLGEDEGPGRAEGGGGGGGPAGGSRLRFVDHQLRQQRALQQLGMMQHNAWRPQRGLPERAVSVLRAWLFEHFLHPYPKDSDKHMLAKQTGLTRSQVSNWFINARVRLWKPMVEEMYLEEVKSQEQHGGNPPDNPNTATITTTTTATTATTTIDFDGTPSKGPENRKDLSNSSSKSIPPPQQNHQDPGGGGGGGGIIQPHHHHHNHHHHHHVTNDMISDMESLISRSPKKQRSSTNSDMQNSPSSILSMDMEMKPPDPHPHRHASLLGGPGFGGPYMVGPDMGRSPFDADQLAAAQAQHYHGGGSSGGVSLTLGLPHCDNLSLSGSHHNHHHHHQQGFLHHSQQGMQLGRRLDVGGGAGDADFCGIGMGQPSSHPGNGFDSIDIQSRKRFAAQLLHNFAT